MTIKRLILALMLVLSFSGDAMADSDFYKSAIQMGTSYCPDTSFDCDNLGQSRAEIIAAANECAASRLDIAEKVMTNFSTSGEFENCVLSDHSVKDRRGVNNWAICCVKKNGEACVMTCTRYIDQK
jgi:hypothetical protein